MDWIQPQSPSPPDILGEGLTCARVQGAPSEETAAGLVPPSRGAFGNVCGGVFLIITMSAVCGVGEEVLLASSG